MICTVVGIIIRIRSVFVFPRLTLSWESGKRTLSEAMGGVAQLVRALACHARGRGFESRHSRHAFGIGNPASAGFFLACTGSEEGDFTASLDNRICFSFREHSRMPRDGGNNEHVAGRDTFLLRTRRIFVIMVRRKQTRYPIIRHVLLCSRKESSSGCHNHLD